MIGIIGAMQAEVSTLCASLTEHTVECHSGTDYHLGYLDGTPVVIARSGIGKVAAAVTAQTMLLLYRPSLLINTGVGGALSKSLHIGDVVISSEALEYDMDTSPLGDPVGFLSGIDRITLPADDAAICAARAAAEALGVRAHVGTVATGDRFVASPEEKARILAEFPTALACEMEGGAIAHTAYLSGTPFLILRAISDSADGSAHMDYPTFVAGAADVSARIVRRFVSAS